MVKLKAFIWKRRRLLGFLADSLCVVLSYWLSFVVGLAGLGKTYGHLFVQTLLLVVAPASFFCGYSKCTKAPGDTRV